MMGPGLGYSFSVAYRPRASLVSRMKWNMPLAFLSSARGPTIGESKKKHYEDTMVSSRDSVDLFGVGLPAVNCLGS
jgi:hypothetical protein